uniref:DUF4160 domain-containing protein n=1 Tax=Caenorhabditis tropicalis TaxID=1561998 RepID=A0A1I7TIM8_9PELO
MIVEIEKELEMDFPCLTREDGLKVGDVFDLPIVAFGHKLDNWTLTVTSIENLTISATGVSRTKAGGAFSKKIDDKWNLIAHLFDAPREPSPEARLIRMSQYIDTICEWAGICEEVVSTTARASMTTTQTSTESRDTKKPEKE